MNKVLKLIVVMFACFTTLSLFAQRQSVHSEHESSMLELDGERQFSRAGTQMWRDASVFGTVLEVETLVSATEQVKALVEIVDINSYKE